ncbi:MAG: DUF2341 domain-containing protein [Euryarchaeota archaeon]|nr:DUF2341 domain-containing protein [Euryarchaeota archaeon]
MNEEKNRNVKQKFWSASVVAMLSLSMLIAVMAPAAADPGWLSGWSYRKDVTISSSSVLTDYQVNVTVDTASLISAGKMNASGDDIRFTGSDGTTLINYWIESGLNTDTTKIWVNVPSVSTTGTTIYMYYGNPTAASDSNYDNTFTKDYGETGLAGLWHMDTGIGTTAADSSGNGNSGTIYEATWVGSDGGQWDGQNVQFSNGDSLSFDGNDYVVVPGSASLNVTDAITLEAWIHPIAYNDYDRIIAKPWNNNEAPWNVYALHFDDADPAHVVMSIAVGTTYYGIPADVTIPLNKWTHVAGTYDGGNVTVYVNGVECGSNPNPSGNIATNAMDLYIGYNELCSSSQSFNGTIDEARIYNRALNLDEIKCHYERRKYASSEPEATIGSEEEEPSQQPIPEFSSIAIPVASILGLLFLFNYRKQRRN